MIRYVQIENFKSLKLVSIPLEHLNLFFGMNGMGKSSVIQSLLLIRQSYWAFQEKSLKGLKINGDLIQLGTSSDILCQNADEEYIRFFLRFDHEHQVDALYRYLGNPLPANVLKIWELKNAFIPFAEDEALFSNMFCYLGAEHIGPQSSYSAMQWDSHGINPLGSQGEYAVPFLALNGNEYRVPDALCLESGKTNRLFDQVSAWMSEISPGVKIAARYSPFKDQAELDISYAGQRIESTPFTPINVGFGIPYVLPLIIALLTSQPGSLLVIENPESHLHPRGQSRIAELIVRASGQGAQIICESHSDHIINGVRIAVKNGRISCKDCSVVYFEKDNEQITKTVDILIDKNGNLSGYPKGFLDEWGDQMAALI